MNKPLNCNKILLMKNEKIIEEGNHNELIEKWEDIIFYQCLKVHNWNKNEER